MGLLPDVPRQRGAGEPPPVVRPPAADDRTVLKVREQAPFRAHPVLVVTIPDPARFGPFEVEIYAGSSGQERLVTRLMVHLRHRLDYVATPGQWISVRWREMPGRRAVAYLDWDPAE